MCVSLQRCSKFRKAIHLSFVKIQLKSIEVNDDVFWRAPGTLNGVAINTDITAA